MGTLAARIKKVEELAKRGVGGERANAIKLLAELKAKQKAQGGTRPLKPDDFKPGGHS